MKEILAEAFWNRLDIWRKSNDLSYRDIERKCGWGEAKCRECKSRKGVLQTHDIYTLVSNFRHTGITSDYLLFGVKSDITEGTRNQIINAYYSVDETTRGIVNRILDIHN